MLALDKDHASVAKLLLPYANDLLEQSMPGEDGEL